MEGSGMNLVTTVIGFGMSATFIIFLCTRLICGRASTDSSRASASAASAAFDLELHDDLDPLPEHTINGLEPVVVAAFPTVKYNKESFGSREDAQCSICLAEYQEKETLRIMPTCGHEFHLTCIDAWLQKQSTCPICRLCLHDSVEVKGAASSFLGRVPRGVGNPEVAGNHSHRRLLPGDERPGWREGNQEIHEALYIDLEATAAGQPASRR